MAKIESDFPALAEDPGPAEDTDAYRARLGATLENWGLAYAELKGRQMATPATPLKKTTRAELLAHLQTLAGQIIKADLDHNPKVPPLDGKPTKKDPPYYSGNDEADAEALNLYRVAIIFVGFPYAPNTFTAADVAAARKG